ncbi:hypothetical protein ACFL6M_02950 [Candidatus Eisenbacteria bacterium]|uniref:L-2-amino-thiazoline-4-carboxylic acid hydrolase n=1 Tax=Eiseniibacteriota bacterium TaxID=2212470 RepID=A0ABV6YK80_UNCEI
MSSESSFEKLWREKFSQALKCVAGEDVRDRVMRGADELSTNASMEEIFAWSAEAMRRLDSDVNPREAQQILLECACQYPRAGLQQVRQAYERTKDTDLAHQMLQTQFESFLRDTLKLNEATVQYVVDKGWGLAGIKQGNKIIATKIPKSGQLEEYLREPDAVRRRRLYCHCPRIRNMVATDMEMSNTYCYCGAGFYKGVWEEILQRPVEIEVVSTVLGGDDACTFEIRLPAED